MLTRDTLFVLAVVGLSACAVSRDGLGQRLSVEQPAETPSSPRDDETEDEAPKPTGRDDARVLPTPDRPDSAVAPPEVDCALTGLQALRLDIEVSWTPEPGTLYVGWTPSATAGQGTMSLLALADARDGVVTLRPCGASLPPVRSTSGVTVRGSIAEATWDAVETRWTANVSTTCDRPGCAVSTSILPAQLGVASPAGEEWPAAADPVPAPLLRDDDGDGRPGLGFTLEEPLRLSAPMGFNWANSVAVTELFVALRLNTQLSGNLDGCGEASGTASRVALQSRVLGCRLDTGSECLDDQTAVLQRSLPTWTAGASRWQLKRLPADSDCEDVRSALP
ncbi:MAG TPA: hypothetical protein VFX59_01980 [Polyangiales bacterium]|nr:hypothetical protein [Polyangiales bacterium]